MANEPDSPDVRSLATITLVGTFVTIAVSFLVVGLTHSYKRDLQESRAAYVDNDAPAVSSDSKQAVIKKYAK
jgi:multidrug resistance efflux pump